MPRGRPKLPENVGTPEQVAKRLYQRKYVNEVRQGVVQLEKDEQDCINELEKIRKEKKKLIDILDSANKQAGSILKEKTKK